MADTPERKVKKKVIAVLKGFKAYYAMPAGTGFGNSGVPDILCCFGGRFIAIECKAGKGKTTKLQDSNLEAIRNAGGIAMVVNEDNVGHFFIDILEQMKD